MTSPDYSKLLKGVRKKLGISQEGLARRLGVSLPTVARWEHYKAKPSGLAREKIEKFIEEVQRGNK